MSHLITAYKNGELKGRPLRQILDYHVGRLSNNNLKIEYFRAWLDEIPSLDEIDKYIEECLSGDGNFPDAPRALQDIVIQIGRRLGFEVEYGKYRGGQDGMNHDGLWRYGKRIVVVEVKTSDTYRIDLDNIAKFREKVISEDIENKDVSILLVLGKERRGLADQIRGSHHAPYTRMIRVKSLLNMAKARHKLGAAQTFDQVREILFPKEFIHLDEIAKLVLSLVEDFVAEYAEDEEETESISKEGIDHVDFHDRCIQRFEEENPNVPSMERRSKKEYSTDDNRTVVVCNVSREYKRGNFWFGVRDAHMEFLGQGEDSYLLFGCGSEDILFQIPRSDFFPWLDSLNKRSEGPRHCHWYVHIWPKDEGWEIRTKKGKDNIDISRYLLS